MKDAHRQTRSYLMELFEQHGFNPRNSMGQNFLIDLNIVEYIVEKAELEPNDVVLEVGAGTGGMTTFLAQQAAEVVSVEVDHNMYKLAAEATAPYDNVTLLSCDALKNKNTLNPEVIDVIREKLDEAPDRRLKLVSNLPYNIATPIVSNLVATELPWSRMIVTIQLELGQRMTAKPSTSDYGALSVWLQSQCRVKIFKKMGPTVFWPRPKVHSAIVRLSPNPRARKCIADRVFFHDFVRRLFNHRRKLLRTVLIGMYRKQFSKPEIDAILTGMKLPEGTRAEELRVEKLVSLANRFQIALASNDCLEPRDESQPQAIVVPSEDIGE